MNVDNKTAHKMLKFLYGKKAPHGLVPENLCPFFRQLQDNMRCFDAYHKLHLNEPDESGWLLASSTHFHEAWAYADILGWLTDWQRLEWIALANRINSGELNDKLDKWGFPFLQTLPLPIDDLSWI